jgi:ATP-dependent DNA ligase
MPKNPFEPCIPGRALKVPVGADWIHEIKNDGYRLIVQREGKRVRLFTRGGHDWTKRFPWIAEVALRDRSKRLSSMEKPLPSASTAPRLQSGKQNHEVQLCAFDVLVIDGEDVRGLPQSMRKAISSRGCAAGRTAFSSIHETSAIGPELFKAL